MRIQFEPSGTHCKNGQIKVRLDCYPESHELSYAQNYVCVEGIWQLNPCLSIFIGVDENVTSKIFKEFVKDIYNSDVMATVDDIMSRPLKDNPHLHAHLISPYSKGKTTLSGKKVTTFDQQTKDYINQQLADISIIAPADGIVEDVEPQSIDIGASAANRAASWAAGSTRFGLENPANADGILDTVEVWFATNASGFETATFYLISGTTYASRDNEAIGDVTSGSKQTFTSLSTDVVTGDFIGYYSSGGNIETDSSGGSGAYVATGDKIPTASQYFSLIAGYTMSLYATGTETVTNAGKIIFFM